jgi:hypothetical protein
MREQEKSTLEWRYFHRPPHRSYYFWVNTVFLLLVAGEWMFYVGRYATRLGPEMTTQTAIPFLAVLVVWFRVLVVHRKVNKAYYRPPDSDAAPTVALHCLAEICVGGLALAILAVGLAYRALGACIR